MPTDLGCFGPSLVRTGWRIVEAFGFERTGRLLLKLGPSGAYSGQALTRKSPRNPSVCCGLTSFISGPGPGVVGSAPPTVGFRV